MDDPFQRHRDIAHDVLSRKYGDFDTQLNEWKKVIRSKCRGSHPIPVAMKMQKRFKLEGDNALWLILATCELMEERKKEVNRGLHKSSSG